MAERRALFCRLPTSHCCRRDKTFANMSAASKLRALLAQNAILTTPGCYDAVSAKLVERAGFQCTFMTGFGVAAVHGVPDTQLITYSDMVRQLDSICDAVDDVVVIGDGDTGYGNALNVKRTTAGYAKAGEHGVKSIRRAEGSRAVVVLWGMRELTRCHIHTFVNSQVPPAL